MSFAARPLRGAGALPALREWKTLKSIELGNQRPISALGNARSSAGASALGRVQIRTADLLQAQLTAMESHARADARRIALAEEHLSQCMQRLAKAVLALDHVLAERGDDEGRRRLVEPALRLSVKVRASADDADVDSSGSGRSARLDSVPPGEHA